MGNTIAIPKIAYKTPESNIYNTKRKKNISIDRKDNPPLRSDINCLGLCL